MNTPVSLRPQRAAHPPPKGEFRDLLSPRSLLIASVCLVATVFAVYSPTLRYQFILDDHRFTSDPRIQNSGHVWDYFANYVWAQFTGGPPSFYRPLFILWLRVNFIVSGLSPWGWHFLSIAKHLAVALLLGFLAWRLLRDHAAAWMAAALFAFHPAHTESVAWVTVPDPLMSACVIGALILYLKYLDILQRRKPQPIRSRKASRSKNDSQPPTLFLFCSVIAYLAALLAKESAIVTPALIFALALLIPSTSFANESGKLNAGWASRPVRAFRQSLPFLGATLLYLLLRFNALGGNLGSTTQHLPLTNVLLSWPAILWFYVKVLFWPVRSYAFADPIILNSFSVRSVLLPALAVVGMLSILYGTVFWANRKARRDLSFEQAASIDYALLLGSLLVILPILPALNLNALNPGDFLHGRYTYLPSTGLMLLVATGWHLSGKWRIPMLAIFGLLVVAFSVLLFSQDKQWKDDLTVFTTAHQLAPHNTPVAKNLANARVAAALQLNEEGRCGDAIPIFEQVIREYPQDWYAWAALGDCQVQLNDLPKAEESLHRAADLSHEPRVIEQWHQLREHMGLPNPAPRN